MAPNFGILARRVGPLGGAVIALLAGAGLLAFVRTDWGEPARGVINQVFTPYDGCMCEDCTEHFLLIPPPRGCVRSGGPEALTVLCWGGSGGTLAGLLVAPTVAGWWRRRTQVDPSVCRGCGYPREGLTRGACPECGLDSARDGTPV